MSSGPERSQAGGWVLAAAILGSSMIFVDSTAVNVALPVVGRDLSASAADLQWIVEGYALTLSAAILIGGALGDRFGRRRIFVAGNVLFLAASLLCGLAPNVEMLIAARFLQGLGGALAAPGSLALISAAFSDEGARGRAIGTWSGFSAMTSAVGPLLGGWLAQSFGWRWVFMINVPFALAVIAIALLRVPESSDPHARGPLDIWGAVLATCGLGALTYGLIAAQDHFNPLALFSIVAGIVALGVFVYNERHAPDPMVPLDIFSNRIFTAANVYTFFLYAALGGALFFVPFNLQNVQHYSPEAAGAALIPFIAIMFVLSRWSGGLVASIGARMPLVAGAGLAACGFLAFGFTGLDRPYWTSFFPAACLLGLGGALFVAPITTTAMNSAGPDRAGTASGLNNAVARVAGLLAIAAFGIVLIGTFYRRADGAVARAHLMPQTLAALAAGRGRLPQIVIPQATTPGDRGRVEAILRVAFTDGFREVMFWSAGSCLVAACVAGIAIGKKSRPSDPTG